jgi:hypothetical protein
MTAPQAQYAQLASVTPVLAKLNVPHKQSSMKFCLNCVLADPTRVPAPTINHVGSVR